MKYVELPAEVNKRAAKSISTVNLSMHTFKTAEAPLVDDPLM